MHWNKICYLDYWCWICFEQIHKILVSGWLDFLLQSWVLSLASVLGMFFTGLSVIFWWLVHYRTKGWVLWSAVLFGLWRCESWSIIWINRFLYCRFRVRHITVNTWIVCWVLVVLMFSFGVNWDHEDGVIILYQSRFSLVCDWYWFYIECDLSYEMKIIVLMIIWSLVLGLYTLFQQKVLLVGYLRNSKRRLDIRKLLLASDYPYLSFLYGLYRSFYWSLKGKLLGVKEGMENSGFHYTHFRQLKRVF